MLYPKDKIEPTEDYFALTFTADSQSKMIIGGQTHWVGWADEHKRIELRETSIINALRMADLWIGFEMPFCVVNSVDDFVRWYLTGGHALVKKAIAEQIIPNTLKPSPCIQIGKLGFTGIRDLPDTIFRRAPTAKQRMQILKRDNYRCRICGRRPDEHVDIELNVHHIRPFGEGGVTHEENLITLCDTCHRGLEPHYEWSLYDLLDSELGEDLKSRKRRQYLEDVRLYRQAMRESQEQEETNTEP